MRQLKSGKLKKKNREYSQHIKIKEILILLDNVEYAQNVAAIFRLADGANVSMMFLTGITKTPPFGKSLSKVSRFKELSVPWEYHQYANELLTTLQKKGYQIIPIEITDRSIPYVDFEYKERVCFIVGNESNGISQKILDFMEEAVFIPMRGDGKSLNVQTSLAIVLYHYLFLS